MILKKPSDDRFIGELYIDRSNEPSSSSNKCAFELGTAPLKDKYINQFIEIFTEEGRRQVSTGEERCRQVSEREKGRRPVSEREKGCIQ